MFYAPSFIILLLVMAVLAWSELSAVIRDAAGGIAGLRHIGWSPGGAAVGGAILLVGLFAALRALAPPAADDWDSLAYHLAVPKLFLKHHGIYYVPFASHSNFPFAWEMLYTLGLAFGKVSLAKLFHFGAWALLVGAVWCAARRHFGAKCGALAAIIVAGVPVAAWEASTAYIDLSAGLYSFLTIYALTNLSATRDYRWAALAGILAGLAAGTKMTALVMIPIAISWIAWPARQDADPKGESRSRLCHSERSEESVGTSRFFASLRMTSHFRKRALGAALLSSAVAIALAAPWYIKSLIYTGNPVYPFLYEVFGGRNWSGETAALYRADQLLFGIGRDAASFLTLPWDLTFRFARFSDFGARLPRDLFELPLFSRNPLVYLSSVGPVFLAAMPALAVGILRRGSHRPLIVVSVLLVAIWFCLMQNSRYLVPALAVLAPAAAHSAELAGIRRVVLSIAVASALFTAMLLAVFSLPTIPVALGLEKPASYLDASFDLYRASEFANENLPEDAKIALFGETRGFYLDREYIWADPGHNALIPFHDVQGDPDKLLAWLTSHDVEYVLVNHSNFPYYGHRSPPEYARLVGEAIGNGLEEMYSTSPDPERGIKMYRVAR